MSDCFVVRNQHGMYANKHKEWVTGRDSKLLFRCKHKDEAINLVFELSSKDIQLRAEAIPCELDDHKQPVVEVTAAEPVVETESNDDTDEANASATQRVEGEQKERLSEETSTHD